MSRAWLRRLESLPFHELSRQLQSLEQDARAGLEAHESEAFDARTFVDLRYLGQATAVTVAVHANGDGGVARLVGDFEREYERTYRHKLSDEPIEVVTLRAVVTAVNKTDHVSEIAESEGEPAPNERRAYFGPEVGFRDAPVLRRAGLHESAVIGPALIDEYDTTIVVPPDATASLTSTDDVVIIV